MLGLGIGGGVAAVLAVVLFLVLTHDRHNPKNDPELSAKGDGGKPKEGKGQTPARDNPPGTPQKDPEKKGPKVLQGHTGVPSGQ